MPTWWSCGWTPSATRVPRRRWPAGASRSSSPAGPRPKAGMFQGSEEERRRILAEALALGAEFVDLEWNGSCADLIAQTGGRRIVLSHHDFDGHAGRPSRQGAGHARQRRRGRQAGGDRASPGRLPHAARHRPADAGADGPDRHGRRRHRHARARQLVRLVLDLRRRQRRARADRPAAAARRSSASAASVLTPPSTASSASRSRTRCRRPCTTRPFAPPTSMPSTCRWRRPTSTTSSTFADALNLAGASVTAPFKVQAFERADECDPVSRRIQSVNTLRRVGTQVARVQHRRRGLPVAARIGDEADRQARHDPRRRRRRPVGGRRAGRRSASRVTLSARRAEQAQSIAALTGATIGEWPPARGHAGTCWSTRRRSAPRLTATSRRCRRTSPSTASWSTTLIYNPPQTRLLRDAAARRLPHDWRPRHAGGAGPGAI